MAQIKPLCKLIGMVLLAAALSACQTLGQKGLASTVTAELTPEAASSVAEDLTEALTHLVGQSETLALSQDGSMFGQTLERALVARGYAITTRQQGRAVDIPLAYVLDSFEGALLVRLSTGEVDLTRVYALTGSAAKPASALSIQNRAEELR